LSPRVLSDETPLRRVPRPHRSHLKHTMTDRDAMGDWRYFIHPSASSSASLFMASYAYYQNAAPGTWGTSQYQLLTPPPPAFQPLPSWRGLDYYGANSGGADSSIFDYAWNKLGGAAGTQGLGMRQAQYWHRRIYGGFSE